MTYRIGFDVGGSKIAAALVQITGNSCRILSRQTKPFPLGRDGAFFAALLREMAHDLEAAAPGAVPIQGVGLALPGSLDVGRGRVIHAHNLGFHDLPLLDLARREFPGQTLSLINDARAAALAELRVGALQGCQTGVMLTLGTGVGGALILQGRLHPGGRGLGTEPGHLLLHQGGRRCSCGNRGCAETDCSATALIQAARRGLAAHRDSLIFQGCQGDKARVNARLIAESAAAGDSWAAGLFGQWLEELSALLASLVNLLDPEIIAIGGGLSACGDLLYPPLRRLTQEKSFFHSCGEIVPARLGNEAGIIGAALAVEAVE